jgi:hypothetical protein
MVKSGEAASRTMKAPLLHLGLSSFETRCRAPQDEERELNFESTINKEGQPAWDKTSN